MLIQYNGPHPEVVVDELNPEQVIVNGEPVDVPDDLAARLLEQSTWSLAETSEEKAAREKREQDEAAAVAAALADAAAQAKVKADEAAVPPTDTAAASADTTTKGNG